MPEGAKPPEHPVRLVYISATNVTSRVRRKRESDPTEWDWDADQPRLVSFSADGQRFACSFQTSLVLPLADDRIWESRLRVLGEFASREPLRRSQGSFFAASSAMFVLLPFARSYFMELGHIAGVEAPPLPLVVRPSVSRPATRS